MAEWKGIRFFRGGSALSITRSRLPHWQEEGGCYFITFRLGDSLPEKLLARFREERSRWLARNPKPWDDETEMAYHRRFSARIDEWLDAGHGRCVLGDPANAEIVAEALTHFDGSRSVQHGFVVMPNHVHSLCSLADGEDLGRLVSSWKSFTAKEVRRSLGEEGSLWQRDYFDRLIRHERHFAKVARYLRRNKESVPSARFYEAPWLTKWLDG